MAESEDKIYIDLADPNWRAVEISSEGWRIVDEPTVRFRRSMAMSALPEPVAGGELNDLGKFIHFGSDDDRLSAASWLVTALRLRGPYPILAIHGEQGSGKSTAARVFRRVIDPSTASVRSGTARRSGFNDLRDQSDVISLTTLPRICRNGSLDALCCRATAGAGHGASFIRMERRRP